MVKRQHSKQMLVCANVCNRVNVGALMGVCAFLLRPLDAFASMMNVFQQCMQSPACQLKEDTSIIEPYVLRGAHISLVEWRLSRRILLLHNPLHPSYGRA